MKPQAIVVTVFLLLLLAGGWLAFRGLDGPSLPPVAVAAGSVDQTAPDASPLAGQGATSQSPAGQAGAAAARETVAARQSLLPPPEDAQWIEIQVVDKQTREPVPSATVGWLDQRIVEELGKRPELYLQQQGVAEDVEQLAQAFGWLGKADERGVARVQQSNNTRVFARSGSRYGSDMFDRSRLAPDSGYVLEIEADLAIRVQVLTAAGTPAVGVLVGFVTQGNGGKLTSLRDPGTVAQTQGPEGIAEFPHVQYLRGKHAEALAMGQTWSVGVLAPALAGEPVPVTLDPLPEQWLQLRLPATGHLRVRVKPQLGPTAKAIYLYASGESEEGLRGLGSRALADGDGWARFPYLPLDRQFLVLGFCRTGLLQRQLVGPTVPDATLDVELAHDPDAILVAGRLLNPEWQPFADVAVTMRLAGPQQTNESYGKTDADGRFLLLSRAAGAEVEVQSIHLEVRDPAIGAWSKQLPGRMLRPGVEQLGDLVLGREPLLVSGQFLVDGEPANPQAHLQLQRQKLREDRTARWINCSGEGPLVRRDGYFEMRGTMVPGRYRLLVMSSDLLPVEPIEFDAGAKDLVVSVQRGATLSVRVLVPEGSRGEILADLSPMDEEAGAAKSERDWGLGRSQQLGHEDHAQLDWRGLQPGKYRLRFRLDGFEGVLEELADIQVPQPSPPDRRLASIDLRPRIRSQPLRLLDAEGRVVGQDDGVLLPLPMAAQGPLAALPLWFGREGMLLPARDLELLVVVRGHQPQRLLCTGAPLEVRLARWPTVRLRLPFLEGWPAGWTLMASLEPRPERDTREVAVGDFDVPIGELAEPPAGWVEVQQQMVALPVGEHAQRIRLRASRGEVSVDLPLAPQSVSAATGEYVVQVDGEAWLRAVAAKGGR
jgi:hypothetical protein